MTQYKKPLHFTLEERKIVEKHYRSKTRTAMAEILGRSVASVLYELKRSGDGPYNAIRAQKDADKKKLHPKKKAEGFSPRKYVRKAEVIPGQIADLDGYEKSVAQLRAHLTKNEETIWTKMKKMKGM